MHPRCATSALAARSLVRLSPPPRLRSSRNAWPRPLRPPQVRGISDAVATTAERASEAGHSADAILNLPWALFETLHAIGLPWAAAIPAGALFVRAVIIMPFLQIPARRAQQRFAALIPLIRAFSNVHKHFNHLQLYGDGPKVVHKPYRQMLPVLGLPVFVAMAETIRRMVGARSGFFGLIFGAGSYEAPKPDVPTDVPSEAAPQDDTVDALASVAEWKGSVALPSGVPETAIQSGWLEPSLATEGMLWFPNLMVPDPMMILPFTVSGLTLATLWVGSKAPNTDKQKPVHLILRRTLMTVALAIGPLTLNMPSGILLYWTASTSCALLSHLYLDFFHPIRYPPKLCKRTIPYRPSKKVIEMQVQKTKERLHRRKTYY